MRGAGFGTGLALVALATGCGVKAPTLPTRTVPAGVVMFQFTRKVRGPVELSIDGVRIPVAQKAKTGQRLLLKGLAPGRHRYFISGPRDAFGPDQGEFELGGSQGVLLRTFSTEFDAVLYGRQEAPPAAEGLPGVQASLEK